MRQNAKVQAYTCGRAPSSRSKYVLGPSAVGCSTRVSVGPGDVPGLGHKRNKRNVRLRTRAKPPYIPIPDATRLGLPVRTADQFRGWGWWCQRGQLIGSPMAVPWSVWVYHIFLLCLLHPTPGSSGISSGSVRVDPTMAPKSHLLNEGTTGALGTT